MFRMAIRFRRLTFAIGPGLLVMLADTDAGSVIAAAQSGAQWGYRLLLLQFALIPALFMSQELASRLGLATRQGLAELALHRLGRVPAILLLGTLAASCVGALITELDGIAGVGQFYGVPVWQSTAAASAGLLAIVLTGSYRVVERVAIAVGLCELAFVFLAWQSKPDGSQIQTEMWQIPLGDPSFLYLVAANLGTCIIPWAIFFQQSASIDKGLTRANLTAARVETLGGAVLCQTITAAVLVASAASFEHGEPSTHSFERVGDIAEAFADIIGPDAGHVLFALGLTGGALVASIVVCLTASWTFGEVIGLNHSLSERPGNARQFYGIFAGFIIAGGALVASGVNLVQIPIAVGVLNAVLLPVTLAFVYFLARYELPVELRIRGLYAIVVAVTFFSASALGLYASIFGLL